VTQPFGPSLGGSSRGHDRRSGIRSGEARLAERLQPIEPALGLDGQAGERLLARAGGDRADVAFLVDQYVERQVSRDGPEGPAGLRRGQVDRHA
jgi:hypothetical protein